MQLKIKKSFLLPLMALMVVAMSFVSALATPADSVLALSAKECRDKYSGKEVTTALNNKFKKDKCAIVLGGPCGGVLSGGKGYFSCPDTSKADTFCKKKYPGDAGKRNACRSGFMSSISGCGSYSGDKKKACDVGKKEYDRLKDESEKEDPEPESGDGGLTGTIEGDGCGGIKTAIIKCDQDNSGDLEDNGVWGLLIIVLNILTAGVGIVAVGGIVYGAVLYTTAEDKADQVKKATDIITNVVIGLIAFALMWAGLNFIVPGGVFN